MNLNDLLKGCRGTNAHIEQDGVVVAAALAKHYKTLLQYDSTGWMKCENDLLFAYDLKPDDILVAFKYDNEEETEVCWLGGDVGIDLDWWNEGNFIQK